jgi:hypothetical protein
MTMLDDRDQLLMASLRDGAALRAEVGRLTAGHEDYVVRANANVCELLGEIERLRAENGRLRSVLATHGWLSERYNEQSTEKTNG